MAPKRNILLLLADDLGTCLGCYDDETIQTPNIDVLAREGTQFSKAFTSTASCSGSRSVIYTGLHTHQSGQYGLNNGHHHFTTFDHVETAPKLLGEKLDYLTGIIGKVHVGPKDVYPWEVRHENATRDVAWVADRAGEVFKQAKSEDRPFFLTVGYVDPHRDRTRGGFGNNDGFDARIKTTTYDPDKVKIPEFLSDLAEVRTELASYYEAISRLDVGIGLILTALKESQLEGDTMVIFLSDNGPPFINSKSTLYDAGVRLPLLVRLPGAKSHVLNPNMVSFIDILPTMLDWAGRRDLKGIRLGRSLLPVLDKNEIVEGWQQQVFGSHTFHEITNYYPTRFMRSERYKYHRNIEWKLNFPFAADLYGSLTWAGIRNSNDHMVGPRSLEQYFQRPPEELYDLEADPHEVVNLALATHQDPKHQALLEQMRDDTEQWQLQTRDPWLYRDGVSIELNRHHIDSGLMIPNRWDFDARNPSGKGYGTYRLGDMNRTLDKPLVNGHSTDLVNHS